MLNSLLHVVSTEMCLDIVCTQPPYLNPPKSLALSQIKPFLDSWLCDITHTQASEDAVDYFFLKGISPISTYYMNHMNHS